MYSIKLLEFLSQLNHLWYLVLQIKKCLHCTLHFPKHELEHTEKYHEIGGWNWAKRLQRIGDIISIINTIWERAVACSRGIFTLHIFRIFAWLHKSHRHRPRRALPSLPQYSTIQVHINYIQLYPHFFWLTVFGFVLLCARVLLELLNLFIVIRHNGCVTSCVWNVINKEV